MIRLAVGVILGAGFLLVGLVIFGASMDVLDRKGVTDGFWAALLIGGGLVFLGVFIISLSFKARKRRNLAVRKGQHAAPDRSEAEGVLMGLGMAHMMNADDSEAADTDSGGDFGD